MTTTVNDESKKVTWLRERSRVLVDTVELSVPIEDDELMLRIELFESLAMPGTTVHGYGDWSITVSNRHFHKLPEGPRASAER